MTLGALLDLGLDESAFRSELSKLGLEGYEIIIEKKDKYGITGTDVAVRLTEGSQDEHHICHKYYDNNGQHHHHEHHGHQNNNHHEDHKHHFGHLPHRNLHDIEHIIDSSLLNERVKAFSRKVFERLAEAEAKVHNKDISEIHFHEVGAVDSIVDIAGTAICLDMLGVWNVRSSILHDGSGFIECAHGLLPVPVPAVAELVAGTNAVIAQRDIPTELITPTGAALITSLSSGFGPMPEMSIVKTGYGFGKRETGHPNMLRVFLGECQDECLEKYSEECPGLIMEKLSVLETNIDNMNPEILGYAMEKLFEAGAPDVFYTPIYMKKNRPAVKLTVLSKPVDDGKLMEIILTETSTLGIRKYSIDRYCMNREIITVSTAYGNVRVKAAWADAGKKYAPEYEDLKKIARDRNIPLRTVYDAVIQRLLEL